MVFSNSCISEPSSTFGDLSPTTKLSTSMENAFLKNGLLLPPSNSTSASNSQFPIRKEFYSIINQNQKTQNELNETNGKLTDSLEIQKNQKQQIILNQQKIMDLKQKLDEKILEVQASQIQSEKSLEKLKESELKNEKLLEVLKDLKYYFVKFKNESEISRSETLVDLSAIKNEILGSHDEMRSNLLKFIETNNTNAFLSSENDVEFFSENNNSDGLISKNEYFSEVAENIENAFDLPTDVNDFMQITHSAESLNNSSTVSENSETSNYFFCESPNSIEVGLDVIKSDIAQRPTSNDNFTNSWLLLFSFIIVLFSIWINFNGSLFGRQPYISIHYSSMPPS